MKKYIFGIAIFLATVILSCKDVLVTYPIPLTFNVEINITTSGGTIDTSATLSASQISQELTNQLDDAGLTEDDIRNVTVEGVAYTIYEPTSTGVTVNNGSLNVGYKQQGPDSLLQLDNVNFAEVAGKKQVVELNPSGVSILDDAVNDIILGNNSTGGVTVGINGSMDTSVNVGFNLRVEMTFTTIVEKEQTVLDPIG